MPALVARPLPEGKVIPGFEDIKSDQWLVAPKEYKLLQKWESGKLFVWEPVPPAKEYAALGHIVTDAAEPPPLDAVRCIRREALRPVELAPERGGIPLPGGGQAGC